MLPTDKQERKERPVARGVLDYFPDAIAAVANVSYVGNAQHNPGEEMHWARGKSKDHADCIARHLMERGTLDDDGLRHSAKVAWRALAMLQLELEAAEDADDPAPVAYEYTSNGTVFGFTGGEHGVKYVHPVGADISIDPATPVGQWNQYAYTYTPTGFVHTPDLAEHTHKANQWLDEQHEKAEGLKVELNHAVRGYTVYVSGPMRGYENNNFSAFDKARDMFGYFGWTVISPADSDRHDKTPMSQREYARRDTEALDRCTHIAMLPGWERSRGALAEFFYARWIGLKALDAETGGPLDTYSRHDICLAMNQYLNGMEK